MVLAAALEAAAICRVLPHVGIDFAAVRARLGPRLTAELQRSLETAPVGNLVAGEHGGVARGIRGRFGVAETDPPRLARGIERLGAGLAQYRAGGVFLLGVVRLHEHDGMPAPQRLLIEEH